MITLYEYLHQKQIVKQPVFSVELEPKDFRYWTAFHNKKWEFSIHIYAFGNSNYRLDDNGGLWTMDDQGNFKSRSVFYINRKKHLDV
jgi:hypothetical protein